jgi:hypothetical protein
MDPRTRDCVLFLGAEGCSECEQEPWLRDPTPAEAEAHRLHRLECARVVTREAPLEIWLYASSYLRVQRLRVKRLGT